MEDNSHAQYVNVDNDDPHDNYNDQQLCMTANV